MIREVEEDELDRLLTALDTLDPLRAELGDGGDGASAWLAAELAEPASAGELAARLRVDADRLELRASTPADWSTVGLGPGPERYWVGPLRITVAPDTEPSVPTASSGLRLRAGGAFGSGLHPSTRLLLEVLVERRPERVLDVGTGSGILALAALALGAGRAVGTDVDRAALTVAADNAAVNGVSGRLELTERPLERLEERFDFVVANILPADLEQMATGLVRVLAPQGTLWLSGLRSAHVTWMQTTFRRLGLRPLSVRHAEDWRAVELLAGW